MCGRQLLLHSISILRDSLLVLEYISRFTEKKGREVLLTGNRSNVDNVSRSTFSFVAFLEDGKDCLGHVDQLRSQSQLVGSQAAGCSAIAF